LFPIWAQGFKLPLFVQKISGNGRKGNDQQIFKPLNGRRITSSKQTNPMEDNDNNCYHNNRNSNNNSNNINNKNNNNNNNNMNNHNKSISNYQPLRINKLIEVLAPAVRKKKKKT